MRRRALIIGLVAVVVAALVTGGSVIWAYTASSGHRHDPADAPSAPVVIVLGAEVGTPFLAGRLAATVELLKAGKAESVLVSGNANGTSGDETRVMAAYLTAHGIPAAKITVDGDGVDTYSTCARAVQVFGIRRALLVTQAYHLPRAVSLCRNLGMDADGVEAPCDCGGFLLFRNEVREWLASVLALKNAIWPPPA
ncbi:vancomycin high temperature exclusion protein [Kutzneria sp. NPDC052558]|uniref:vancomycin high temperature exclusion protein n=1 Tax=Kutzneria sp. NPDC052558 TaxID=3364121 RepID=UPI0037C7BE71